LEWQMKNSYERKHKKNNVDSQQSG
jgi:hypothetical protein